MLLSMMLMAQAHEPEGARPAIVPVQVTNETTTNVTEGADKKEAAQQPDHPRTLAGAWAQERTFDATGIGQELGYEGVVTETAQILGQIVVTRAQQAAYERIQEQLKLWLECGVADAPFPFTATCGVVGTLRLEDIATQPEIIVDALVSDALAQALPSSALDKNDLAKFLRVFVVQVVSASVEGQAGAEATLAPMITEKLISLGKRFVRAGGEIETPTAKIDQVLFLASSAIVVCQATGSNECNISKEVYWAAEQLKITDPVVLVRAGTLGSNAWLALSWSPSQTSTEAIARARARYAVDATFDATCWSLDFTDGCVGVKGTTVPSGEAALASAWLALARPIVEAAVSADTNVLVAAIGSQLDEFVLLAQTSLAGDARKGLTADQQRAYARAFGILGTLASYAGTFVESKASEVADAAKLHEQRTVLLESLVESYTSRRGREGDWIPSLAGSLDLRAGGRTPLDGGDAFMDSPVGLPIGFGVHHIPEVQDGRPGFLVQAGLVDLGQYLGWHPEKGGLVVDEPAWTDLFAPSLSVGATWGKQVPFALSAYGSLAPTYDPERTIDGIGSIAFGVRAGMYVPLLDVN